MRQPKKVAMSFRASIALAVIAITAPVAVVAQDPGPNWIVYAKATCPRPDQMITKMSAKWIIPENGEDMTEQNEFWTPWFGIETTDNLNLLQPVTCWGPDSWTLSTEYFQWTPDYNFNSEFVTVSTGNLCYGEVVYLPPGKNSTEPQYRVSMGSGDSQSSASTWQIAPIQIDSKTGARKNYTNAYVVFEHPFHKCHKYPKSDKMEFFDIVLECNGQRVVDPKWTTGEVKRVCDFEAHVVNASRIKFTWDHDKPEVHP
jgi:hypothetical protein